MEKIETRGLPGGAQQTRRHRAAPLQSRLRTPATRAACCQRHRERERSFNGRRVDVHDADARHRRLSARAGSARRGRRSLAGLPGRAKESREQYVLTALDGAPRRSRPAQKAAGGSSLTRSRNSSRSSRIAEPGAAKLFITDTGSPALLPGVLMAGWSAASRSFANARPVLSPNRPIPRPQLGLLRRKGIGGETFGCARRLH